MSMKNATPRFSARANALAAPKKLDPTMRPRATSSAHSTGALNRKRSSTEPQTTSRSAASRTAAVASLMASNGTVIRWPPLGEGAAPDMVLSSGLRRADHVHYGFGFGARLDEIFGLRKHALAEGFLVAFDNRDALVGQVLERLFLHLKTMGAGIGCRLFGCVEKSFTQFRVHSIERCIAEIGRERREIMLRQRVVLRSLVELAGEDGRRIMFEPVEHAGLQGRVDFTERQRRRGGAHQAKTLGDDGIGQGSDLEACEIFRRLHGLLGKHAARTEIVGPGDDPDIRTLEQRLLDRLGGAGIECFCLLWKTGGQITEVKGPAPRPQIGRDRRTAH